jgi:transcriptional regulator with XRE-family HTH domain
MKNRIKQIRKEKNLTQVEFGEHIGVKGNTVTNYETGLRNPTDAVILSICREFNVNEDWLRNGTGKMYKERDGSFSELLVELEDSDDDFIKSLITVYMGLDKDSKSALRKIAKGMAEKYKSREN